VSINDINDIGEIIDTEYIDMEDEEYEYEYGEDEPEIEDEGLQLWDRVTRRRENTMLDRETLMDVFGENEYDMM
jgi:hypothetical protein